MKTILFILLIANFSTAQINEHKAVDFLGTNEKNGYITFNQKGEEMELVNMDSLQALKIMYKFVLNEQKEKNELSFMYQDALKSIQKCVDLLNHLNIPKTQLKRYKLYIDATKKQGYKEIKK